MKSWIISLALSFVASGLKVFGVPSLTEILVGLGKAFGPLDARHFSELTVEEQKELVKRAPILAQLHTDWPKPLQWVPRTLTAYVVSAAPPIIAGTGTVEDIPEPGTYVVTRGYVALTTRTKFHMRFGWRWDRNDHYLEFPSLTAKQLG